MYRVTGGAFTLLGQTAHADAVTGTWYDLRLEVVGTSFDLYIDDVLALSTSDGVYASGLIGLLAYDGSNNEYDDVVVTGDFVTSSGTYDSNALDTGAWSDFQDADLGRQ